MIRAVASDLVAMRISRHRTRSAFDRYDITPEADLEAAAAQTSPYVVEKRTEAQHLITLHAEREHGREPHLLDGIRVAEGRSRPQTGRSRREGPDRGGGAHQPREGGLMKSVGSSRGVTLALLCLLSAASPAHAITGAICISATLNGSLKMRATGVCKLTEIRLGSFDGTTLQFSGINVQVVSGSGATDGAVNGKGNLIVGYNKASLGQTRTGSHNLVVGDEHAYSSYGGLIAGVSNTIAAAWASVSGGEGNTASGEAASVSGGSNNTASGRDNSVSGGWNNTASEGHNASVSGGFDNTASGAIGFAPSVSGGAGNTASGYAASVSGGVSNVASGDYSSISGGGGNTASGITASVSGGGANAASGIFSSISGGSGLNQPLESGWAAGSTAPGTVIVGNFESP